MDQAKSVTASVLGELCSAGLTHERQSELVLQAEELDWTDINERHILGSILLGIAHDICDRNDEKREPVLWSAMRMSAALLGIYRIDNLTPFLAPPHGLDTRTIALQCIGNVATANPNITEPLSVAAGERVSEIITKLADHDTFTSGDCAALLMNAVYISCIARCEQRFDNVYEIRLLKKRWFCNLVVDKLREATLDMAEVLGERHWRISGIKEAISDIGASFE